MKRGDMPAMALSGDAYTDFAGYDGTNRTSYNPECQGMTIRERMAIEVTGAIISGALANGQKMEYSDVARGSCLMADALLAELDRTGGGEDE